MVLRTLDTDWLKDRGEVRSALTEEEVVKRAQEHVAQMFVWRSDDRFMRTLNFRQQFMYCHLLKMVSIQLQQPRATVPEKTQQYFHFFDSELATLNMREAAIARTYFERGQRLAFFGKVQVNKRDLFEVLNGMAWDLWHVRQSPCSRSTVRSVLMRCSSASNSVIHERAKASRERAL